MKTIFDRAAEFCDRLERDCCGIPSQLRTMLPVLLRQVALDAAACCDQRAAVEEKTTSVRSEATKCGAAVRHYLLCGDGESVCYLCSGAGCTQCQNRGVREVRRP